MIRSKKSARLLILMLPLAIHVVAWADGPSILVHIDSQVQPNNRLLTGVCLEDVNHEIYGGLYSQMIFGESFQEPPIPRGLGRVSGMWRPIIHGSATADYFLDSNQPFVGSQSQKMTYVSGDGEIGIDNRGLSHCGMNLVAGRTYDGCLWARADAPTNLIATLQNKEGTRINAAESLDVPAGDWIRLDFRLTPDRADADADFALKLSRPGSVTIGYVFLEPGPWGRFKNLPVRKDVIDVLLNHGVDVIRYGGSMVNSPAYHWKNMIGPRDRRPPYAGHYHRYSTNGWGVIDFLNLCEAANVLPIPDLNADESPRDIADFIQYVNGPASSDWGRRRAADGHPAPYRLTHLEIGNEERVDATYAAKFNAIAHTVWAIDPDITLIVGDFSYKQTISDPDHITRADSGITDMDGHRSILEFARVHSREVWFDVHVWSEAPEPSPDLIALPSYIDAIDKLANGAKHKVVCFELNANTHGQLRALANAISINTIRRDNRMPMVTSANALQPDGQNDNGWNQGLLFLDPSSVWPQPPLQAMRMHLRYDLPILLRCDVSSASNLDVTATRSFDGKTLSLQIVNPGPTQSVAISLAGFTPTRDSAHVTELVAPNDAANTADHPDTVHPTESDWHAPALNGTIIRQLPSQSFTIIQFK
jgi:alpha-L-arabinofuranosidase